jgi:hypothetical protein
MTRMMATVDSGEHVPQIWSIIILLLRSKRWNLEQYNSLRFDDWLAAIEAFLEYEDPFLKMTPLLKIPSFAPVSEVRERMTRMMATVDSGEHVPQIWSIIILLLRSSLIRWG